MTFINSGRISRRLLKAMAVTSMLIALTMCQLSMPQAVAQSIIGVEFIFDVVPDNPVLTTLPATGTTFYIQGKIYPFRTVNQADCTFRVANPRQVGVWRAWGQVADDGRLVINQSLLLDLINGTIEVQGTTGVLLGTGGVTPARSSDPTGPTTGPTEVLSITGGAGAYRGLTGEAQIRPYCSDPSAPFRYDRAFCFQVVQGKRQF
jgi:hypothetical protein